MYKRQRLLEIATEGIGLLEKSTHTIQTALKHMHEVMSRMEEARAELLEDARSEHNDDHTRYDSADERLHEYHLVKSNNDSKAILTDYKHDNPASQRESSKADDTKTVAHRAIVDPRSKKASKEKQSKATPESQDVEGTDVDPTVTEHEAREVAHPTPVSAIKVDQPSRKTRKRKADDLAAPVPDQARKHSRYWSYVEDNAEPVDKVRKTERIREAQIDGNKEAMLGSKDSRTTRAAFMKGRK